MKFSLAYLAVVSLTAQSAIADGWFGSAGTFSDIDQCLSHRCDTHTHMCVMGLGYTVSAITSSLTLKVV